VTWLPYELHPNVPPEGIPTERYFGGGRFEQMRSHMRGIAAEVGLTLEQRDVLINSRKALGAAEFAREHGKFEAMHRALLEAHWHLTGRLEDVEDLKRIGESVGLDPEELGRALEEGRYEPLIDEYRRQAEGAGINAIPAHIFSPHRVSRPGGDPGFGRRYLILGAQPYEVFLDVLDRLEHEAEPGS
jgi:predicted DsbA family dithiol-disulfide isomerase